MWPFYVLEVQVRFVIIMYMPSFICVQVNNGLVLPDKAALYLTAIEDAEYKEDKIDCELTTSCSSPCLFRCNQIM